MLGTANLTSGVAIPKGLLTGKTYREQVHETVAIDVVGKGEEAVGISLNGKGRRFIDLGLDLEIGSEIDKWARDNVSVPIAIKVGRARSL